MRHNRTLHPPLFELDRPGGATWHWEVTYKVASSGYPTHCHVTASRITPEEHLMGTAACTVGLGDDLREVIECLALEAMLAACEPTLFDVTPHRAVVFTSHL